MKAKFVNESLNEDFYDDDRFEDVESDTDTDIANDVDDDVDDDEEDVEATATPFDMFAPVGDGDDDEDDIYVQDELETALNNELDVPEYARREISFKVKGEPGTVDAVPMARMKDGSFLMKVNGNFRKFKMSDIIEESYSRGKRVN